MKKMIFGLLFLFIISVSMVSEEMFIISKNESEMVINGTSTLHDWKMDLKIVDGKMNVNHNGIILTDINNVSFSCKEKDIKSESSIMDKKAYEALKSEKYPEIKFVGISTSNVIIEDKKFKGTLKGNLSLAGETEEVNIPFRGTFDNNNTISVTGNIDIKMSDFEIVPPTALMGAIEACDAIMVSFSFKFTN